MDETMSPDDLLQNARAFEKWVFKSQETKEAKKFATWFNALKAKLRSRDPKVQKALREANAEILKQKAQSPNDVHVPAVLETLSIMFANKGLVGDQLMPFVPVEKKSDLFYTYDKQALFDFPDDTLSVRGQANEVRQNYSTSTYMCVGRGLNGFVDVEMLQNADKPLDPMADETLLVNLGIAWRREMRIAAKVSDPTNYGNNVLQITPANQWNSAGGGTPIADIQGACDTIYDSPGNTMKIGFCSINVFRVLARHPQILRIYNAPTGGPAPGLVSRTQLAAYFELDDLIIGTARKNMAAPGQTPQIVRIFPDVFGVMHVSMTPTVRSLSWGHSFRFGPVETFTLFERKDGVRGQWVIGIRTSEDHKVIAPEAGFLITSPIG